MSLSTLPDRVVTKPGRVYGSTDPRDADFRLPLRAELFLLAHDDATGQEHLDRRSLCLGLAGAILLELWLEQRILIGKRYLVRDGRYTRDLGASRSSTLSGTAIRSPTPPSPCCDGPAARFTSPTSSGSSRPPTCTTGYAVACSPPECCAASRTAGSASWERDRYLAIRPEWVVRARAKVRNLPRNGNKPQTVALGSLVAALGLTRNLFHAEPVRLHGQVMEMIRRFYDSTPWDVQAAINPANLRRPR